MIGLGHQETPLGPFVLFVRLDRDIVNFPFLEILAPPIGSQRDRVKLLTAVAAEVDRVQALFPIVGIEDLSRKRDVALTFGTKSRIQASRAGDELMEFEGEKWFPASIGYAAQVFRRAESNQGVPKSRLAVIFGKPAIFSQIGGRHVERNGTCPFRLVINILQANPCLDPDGQIIIFEIGVRAPVANVAIDGGLHCGNQTRQFAFAAPGRVGHTAECFRNDRIRSDFGAEDHRGNSGHRCVFFFRVAFACHGRGCAHANRRMARIANPRLKTAYQHRHVRALAATVRMQLIEHDELQTAAVFDDLPVEIVLPRHEQLEHHEVRQ